MEIWGNTTRAMEAILSAPTGLDLDEVPEMVAFWNWRFNLTLRILSIVCGQWHSPRQLQASTGSPLAMGQCRKSRESLWTSLTIREREPNSGGVRGLWQFLESWPDRSHLQSGREVGEEKRHLPSEVGSTVTMPSSSDGVRSTCAQGKLQGGRDDLASRRGALQRTLCHCAVL